MARNFFTHCPTAEVALTAATAKTIAQLIAASGVRVAIQSICVSFDGVTSTNEPVIIEVLRQTTAGTMTSRNPQQKDSDIATALQVTGAVNASAEPTAGAVLASFECHPQAGMQYPFPMPGEIIIPGGGRLGIRVTAPAGVNCTFTIEGEE